MFQWGLFHLLSYSPHTCNRQRTNYSAVNDSDLDSVTLKAYKVKDCGRNLGSENCI